MSYTKTNWQNDQAPAINATNLNKIEQGIYDNDNNISNINGTLGVDTNTWVGTTAYGEGDIVIYNDKIYQNISGTSTTTNPADDTTNWDEITIFDTDSINDDLIDKTKFIKNTNTNSAVNSYSCDYSNKHYGGVVLYENSTGTTGDVSLTMPTGETLSNYSYIEIYAITDDNEYFYTKAPSVVNKNVVIAMTHYYDNVVYTYVKSFKINASSLTINTTISGGAYYGGGMGVNNRDNISVVKVIGYK